MACMFLRNICTTPFFEIRRVQQVERHNKTLILENINFGREGRVPNGRRRCKCYRGLVSQLNTTTHTIYVYVVHVYRSLAYKIMYIASSLGLPRIRIKK